MIRYLQRLKGKKGFTLVELIIVIAIIAILLAFTIPAFNNDDAKRSAVDTYASDFYSGLQYNMTRYQKTEADISPAIKTEVATAQLTNSPVYIKFDSTAGQNVLGMPFIYIEAHYDNGLKYVHVGRHMAELVGNSSTSSDTAFEKLLHNDMQDIVNGAGNGYYYAVVTMNNTYNDLKVVTVHFTYDRIKDLTPANLEFVDFSELANGYYCGTCTSDNTGGEFCGAIGTNFLNTEDYTTNNLWGSDES